MEISFVRFFHQFALWHHYKTGIGIRENGFILPPTHSLIVTFLFMPLNGEREKKFNFKYKLFSLYSFKRNLNENCIKFFFYLFCFYYEIIRHFTSPTRLDHHRYIQFLCSDL